MTTLEARPECTSRAARDVITYLTIYEVLRIVLPSQYVIGPLGGAGQPAQLLGLGLALSWVTDWLGRSWPRRTVAQPLKRLALTFLMAILVSYLIAAMRPLSSAEQLASDRSMLNFIAWIGVMLAAMDGISSRGRLDTLLRRVVLLGALEGCLGVTQLLAKQSFLQYFALPGLSNTGVDPLLLARGSFLRPVGTAISPIEYGVFLSMVLPIALHYAVSDVERISFISRWFPVAVIGCALALSLTRSAMVCTAIALVFVCIAWPPRLRRRVAAATAVFISAAFMTLHGFIGTILSLFNGIGTDASTVSRVGSYSVAWSFIVRSPIFGRGAGTFLPEYWILDNQYLGSLIELGVVGLACMLLLFSTGIVTSWRIRRSVVTRDGKLSSTPNLGGALAAALAAGCAGFAFFDAYTFPMVPSMVFLILGCVGALRRLTMAESALLSKSDLPETVVDEVTIWGLVSAVRRWWPITVVGLILCLVGSYAAATVPGVYYEQAKVLFVAPDGSLQHDGSGLVSTAATLASQLGEQGPLALSSTATIVGTGAHYGAWVRLPNDGDQWETSFAEEELDVEAVGSSVGQVNSLFNARIANIKGLLRRDQISVGVPANQFITSVLSPASVPVTHMSESRPRAGVAAFVVGTVFTIFITVIVDAWADKKWRKRYKGASGIGLANPL